MKVVLVSLKNDSGCPPIGLVNLATYLNRHGHHASIIDFNFDEDFDANNYDAIGISCMTKDYGRADNLAGKIRICNKKIPIYIGGVHISTLPESLTNNFTAGVLGEGEYTFLNILKGESLDRTAGVVYHSSGIPHVNSPAVPIADLDSLPRPDWSLVNPNYFEYKPNTTWGQFCSEGVMLTGRGCPYSCVFCSTKSFWGNHVRFYSPEYVELMVEDLAEFGVTHIQIWDDLFTVNKNRLALLAHKLYGKGLAYSCQPRVDKIDNETCQLLKQIGVKLCIFGFESGNERVLKYLKKDTVSLEDNFKAIRMCRDYRLEVQGSVIFGSPGETEEEMAETTFFMRMAYEMGVQRIWSFVLTPFPATELWEKLKINWRSPVFTWEVLSHQNLVPLCGPSMLISDFLRFIRYVHKVENKFKWRKFWLFFRNNPFRFLWHLLTNGIRSGV